MPTTRKLLRLAQKLHAVYERRHRHHDNEFQSDCQRMGVRIQEVQRLCRTIEKANTHGWRLASRYHSCQLAGALCRVRDATGEMRTQWFDRPLWNPNLNDLFAELQHLQSEFGGLVIERTKAAIGVTTDSIVLEGIELGPFSIRLHWPRLADRANVDCFEVVALEPNPAANDRTVTHPHVKNHHLCAGDATIPVQRALEQGRLIDAFCLIRSVLETYYAKRAYVSLDDWNGVTCWNCSYVAEADDVSSCDRCEHDFCSECMSSCEQCGRAFCTSCQTQCAVCDSVCCLRCLKTSACSATACCAKCLKVCAACGDKVATSDFDAATERCSTCNDEETTEQPEVLSIDAPSQTS